MSKHKTDSNIIEKITFFGGLIIVLALVGYLVYQLVERKDAPPQLEITSSFEPGMKNNAYRVQVENRGTETAEGTQIKFELYQQGKVTGTVTLQIKYVPSRSTETGWVVFTKERQATDSLVVSSVTFVKP